jgi:hypothetical protein
MSSFGRYTPRRRREEEEEREGGGLPVIPLMIIVIFAGLLLGGLLAHIFGGTTATAQLPLTPPPVTPVAVATPSAHARAPRLRPKRVAAAQPLSAPRPSRGRKPAPQTSTTPPPSATPITIAVQPNSPKPRKPLAAHPVSYESGAPAVHVEPLSSAASATLPPTATPSPATRPADETTHERSLANTVALHVPKSPEGVVRAYLSALVHGDDNAAAQYLASGSPTEQFVRGGRIEDVSSVDNGDGTYQVTADVSTRDGRYYVIATVAALPYGMLITDHYHIKPH